MARIFVCLAFEANLGDEYPEGLPHICAHRVFELGSTALRRGGAPIRWRHWNINIAMVSGLGRKEVGVDDCSERTHLESINRHPAAS
jgi:hypothetical protein